MDVSSELPTRTEQACAAITQLVNGLSHDLDSVLERLSAPMPQLPIEILSQIFIEMVQSHTWHKEVVCNLMFVCDLWRQSIIDTPIVWSFIEFDDGPRYVSLALERSRNYPLTIYHDGYESAGNLKWFLEAIAKHSRRWLTVDLTLLPRPWECFMPILHVSAPMLRSFAIKDAGEDFGGIDWSTLFDGEPLPHLEHLEIWWFNVYLEPKSFTSLEYLTIGLDPSGDNGTHITPDKFAAILRNNRGLRKVHLEDFLDASEETQGFQPVSSEPINLPHLQKLKLEDVDSPYVDAVLPFLVFPDITDFGLEIRTEELSCFVPQPFPGMEAWLRLPTRDAQVKVSLSAQHIEVSVCRDLSEDLEFVITYPQSDETVTTIEYVASFMERLPASGRCALCIQDSFYTENISEQLCRIQSLRRLHLMRLQQSSVLSILACLWDSLTQDEELYPLPNLEVLRIDSLSAKANHALLQMLRARYAEPFVTRLKTLEVPSVPPDVVADLESIVGEGVLSIRRQEEAMEVDHTESEESDSE